jgi:signal transduction histidine kinase
LSSREILRPVVIAGLGAAVGVALSLTPPLRRLDPWAGDVALRAIAPVETLTDAVLVVVDDESMTRLRSAEGNWPYSRELYARVAAYLTAAGARAIVFDILFAEPRPGDVELARVLPESAPAVFAAVTAPYAVATEPFDRMHLAARGWSAELNVAARTWRDVQLPRPEFVDGAALGVATIEPDEDGIVRRMPTLHRVGGVLLPALHLAARFPQTPGPRASAPRDGRLRVGDGEWPVDRNGDVALVFPRAPHRMTIVPIWQVVEAAAGAPRPVAAPDVFRGRTIFIGSTALLLGEATETPMGRVPGVVLAAHAYLSLTHNLVLAPKSWSWSLVVMLAALVLPLAIRIARRDSLLALSVAAGLGCLAAVASSVGLLASARQPTSLVAAGLATLTTFILFLVEHVAGLRVARHRLASERLAVERASQLKSEFLAHVSHELRTPLTAILGFSRVLADEQGLAPDKRALVQIIRRNGEQLLWLVNNLLDQARIAASQMTVEAKATAVRELLDQVMGTLSGIPRRARVVLQSSCGPNVPEWIAIDGQRLQQIAINLAANALRFTEEGRVDLHVDWADSWLDLSVEDTGPGITPAALDDIFEAFNQGDPSAARRGGTGLGLTISRNLARLMGGELTVTSVVDRGSTFRLRVPAPKVDRPTDAVRLAAAAGLAATTASNDTAAVAPVAVAAAPRALIADDSEDIRTFLQIYLQRLGLEVLVAENGRRAVEMAVAERPDVVLMDVQMPELSGVDAVQLMRRAGLASTVVALTAGSGEQLAHELRGAGFDAVVFKPVTGDELSDTVTRLLGLPPRPVRTAASPR